MHSSSITRQIAQTSHGFSVGDVVSFNGSSYAKAKADAFATAGIGVVAETLGSDAFVLCESGFVSGFSGLTSGGTYYLSDVTAGGLTINEPSISQPILVATSPTEGVVLPRRPIAKSALIALPDWPVCVVNVNPTISIGASANTPLTYGNVQADNRSAYSTSTGLYTVPEEGLYDISINYMLDIMTHGYYARGRILDNGAPVGVGASRMSHNSGTGTTGSSPNVAVRIVRRMSVNDTISADAFHNDPNASTINASSNNNMCIIKIRD